MSIVKLGIVMGGGVSLGSFGGGALAGALRALAEHAEREDSGVDAVEVDVLSGASAGAMSLCLLLRHLAAPGAGGADEGDFFESRVAGPQWRAWVEETDIDNLLGRDAPPSRSLLSSAFLSELAEEMIHWPAGTTPVRAGLHPRLRLGPRVHFLATLMNLNGLPVASRRLARDWALVDATASTLYEDRRLFRLDLEDDGPDESPGPGGLSGSTEGPRWVRFDREALAHPESWRIMAETCLAAGAFPVAFEPRAVRRAREEYGPLWPWREDWPWAPDGGSPDPARSALKNDLWFDERDHFPFTYGDGGAFNNEPLKEAMELIRVADDRDPRDFQRLLLFVDPNLSGTAQAEFLGLHEATRVTDDGTEVPVGLLESLVRQAGPLASAIAGQAAFRDVRQADRVNERLRWRDDLRAILGEMVDRLPDEALDTGAAGVRGRVENALDAVLKTKSAASLRGRRYEPDAEVARVRKEEAGPGGDSREELRHLLFSLVDQVAGLRNKRRVRVLAVGPVDLDGTGEGRRPEPVRLAGAFLRGFGGFLHRDFRRHDFEWGRRKGRRVVRAELEGTAGDEEDPPPEWPGEDAWRDAKGRLVEAAGVRYAALARELDDAVGAGRGALALGGFWYGFRGLLMRGFRTAVAPWLARTVDAARAAIDPAATEASGWLRVVVRVEDGRGDDGPRYLLEPGTDRVPTASDWGARWRGGTEVSTWVAYHLRPRERPSPSPGWELAVTGGPHLRAAGAAGESALVLGRVEDGTFAGALPLSIPLDGESGFGEAILRRRHLLGRGTAPVLRVTVDLRPQGESNGDPLEGRPAPPTWEVIPALRVG